MRLRLFWLLLLIAAATDALALEVTMTATVNEGAQVTVSGSTNLPDGTELQITLSDPERVRTQDKVFVKRGAFNSLPFMPPLCTDCTLTVISQIAAYQPASVRSVIGECGELLAGRHVVKGSVGGLIVSYHAKSTLSKKAAARKNVPAINPKLATQKKTPPPFNRYSSYCVLKAAGRKDLPPMPDALTRR